MSGAVTVAPRRAGLRWWAPRAAFALVAAFALIQLVPYGRAHGNPPVRSEPRWDSPRTKALFAQACGACHSNLTTWPWYSNAAPVSWLVQHDVEDGRARFDVSEWRERPQPAAAEVAAVVRAGEMPPLQYRLIHSEARLSSAQRAALAAGLERTFRASPPLHVVAHGGDDG
ncbi:MAG: heme-binding domain-containing protein [Actinobacteria bacterium]|nr:heme-binding domain-containing protein [Actinomycetota bacterium]